MSVYELPHLTGADKSAPNRQSPVEPIFLSRDPGVHPKIAQERLGHSTITTTMDLYSHVIKTMQKDAADQLDKAFRRAMSGTGSPK
jgi:hypothetical protein